MGTVNTDTTTGRTTVTICAVPGRPSSYTSGIRVFLEWFLGETLESYVRRKRAGDPPRAWRGIADDMARDVEAAAARMNPDAPPLRVAISHTVPYHLDLGANTERKPAPEA